MSEQRIAALEARIRELEDKDAITRLIHRYAECARDRDKAGGMALLSEDVVFELRHVVPGDPLAEGALMTRFEGPAAMVAGYDSEAGAANMVWPMIHNIEIEVSGDEARASCIMASAIWPVGKQFVGEYRDRLRRTDGGWRFIERICRLIGEVSGTYAAAARADFRAIKASQEAASETS